MTEVKMLTAKQLAEKAGISPAELRKLLRKEFNRAGKTKVEGNRMEYRFAANDPIVKQIMEKAKVLAAEKPEAKQPGGQESAN
jgi:3-hydroxyisobutyrate dehydrogenase-like beta-hydroxyacid dehydrogenase